MSEEKQRSAVVTSFARAYGASDAMERTVAWGTHCMWTAEIGPLHARILYFGERFSWLVYDTRKPEDKQDLGKGDCGTLVEALQAAEALLGARGKGAR